MYLHIPKYRTWNCEEETHPLSYKMKMSASIDAKNNSDENEMFVLNEISKYKKKKKILSPMLGTK